MAALAVPTVLGVAGDVALATGAVEIAQEVSRKGIVFAGKEEAMKRLKLSPETPFDPLAIFKAGLRIQKRGHEVKEEHNIIRAQPQERITNRKMPPQQQATQFISTTHKGFHEDKDGDLWTDNYKRPYKKRVARRRPYKRPYKPRVQSRRRVQRVPYKKPWRAGQRGHAGASRRRAPTRPTYGQWTYGRGARSRPTWTRRRPLYY